MLVGEHRRTRQGVAHWLAPESPPSSARPTQAITAAFVQHLGEMDRNGASDVTTTLTVASLTVTSGNTIAVICSFFTATAGTPSAVDNLGNAYTMVEVKTNNQTQTVFLYAPVTVGGTLTSITVTHTTSGFASIEAAEFSGVGTMVSAGNGQSINSASPIYWATGIVPIGGIAIGGVGSNSNNAMSAGPPYGSPQATPVLVDWHNGGGNMSTALLYALGDVSSEISPYYGYATVGVGEQSAAGAIFNPAVAGAVPTGIDPEPAPLPPASAAIIGQPARDDEALVIPFTYFGIAIGQLPVYDTEPAPAFRSDLVGPRRGLDPDEASQIPFAKTRLYVAGTQRVAARPVDGSWELDEATPFAEEAFLGLSTTPDGVAGTVGNTLAPSSGQDVLSLVLVSPPLAADTTIWPLWVRALLAAEEAATGNDYRAQLVVKVTNFGGDVVRGVLIAHDTGTLSNEYGAFGEATTAFYPRGWRLTAGGPINALRGDRIVLEVGSRTHDAPGVGAPITYASDEVTDAAEEEQWVLNGITPINTWVDIAQQLTFDDPNAYLVPTLESEQSPRLSLIGRLVVDDGIAPFQPAAPGATVDQLPVYDTEAQPYRNWLSPLARDDEAWAPIVSAAAFDPATMAGEETDDRAARLSIALNRAEEEQPPTPFTYYAIPVDQVPTYDTEAAPPFGFQLNRAEREGEWSTFTPAPAAFDPSVIADLFTDDRARAIELRVGPTRTWLDDELQIPFGKTRFYVRSAFAGYRDITSGIGFVWHQNEPGNAPAETMLLASTSPDGTSQDVVGNALVPPGSDTTVLHLVVVTPPLASATTIWPLYVRGIFATAESTTTDDYRAEMVVKVINGDGSVVRGVLVYQDDTSGLSNEYPRAIDLPNETLGTRFFPVGWRRTFTSGPIDAQAGDRLQFELGSRTFDGPTLGVPFAYASNQAADATREEQELGFDAVNSWIEVGQALTFIDEGVLRAPILTDDPSGRFAVGLVRPQDEAEPQVFTPTAPTVLSVAAMPVYDTEPSPPFARQIGRRELETEWNTLTPASPPPFATSHLAGLLETELPFRWPRWARPQDVQEDGNISFFVPPPPPAPPPTFYGPAIGADDLNNTQIGGPGQQQAAYRFRAAASGTITQARIYVIDETHPGYGAGTGGTFRCQIVTDDGTSNHFPTSTALATTDFSPTDGAGYVVAFSPAAPVTAGTIYHVKFTNIDASPGSNYASLDGTYQATANPSQWQPRFTNLDYVQLLKQGAGAWTDSRGNLSVITPMLDLTYGDGTHQGMGYIETWGRGGSDGYNTCDGTITLREAFTISGGDRMVSRVHVRLARSAGSAALSVRLETSAGALIETVDIPAASIPSAAKGGSGHGFGQDWVAASFASPHLLTNGSSYNLVWSTTAGTEYWTTAIRQGSSYGYTSATYYADGKMQRNTGAGWVDVLSLSGSPSAEGDMQFYFDVATAAPPVAAPLLEDTPPVRTRPWVTTRTDEDQPPTAAAYFPIPTAQQAAFLEPEPAAPFNLRIGKRDADQGLLILNTPAASTAQQAGLLDTEAMALWKAWNRTPVDRQDGDVEFWLPPAPAAPIDPALVVPGFDEQRPKALLPSVAYGGDREDGFGAPWPWLWWTFGGPAIPAVLIDIETGDTFLHLDGPFIVRAT